MNRLLGKRALVTGAGTGIGREIALEFAREGADVCLHYVNETAGVEEARQQIALLGRRVEVIQADFSREADVAALAEAALAAWGGIDCLVNNAGITFNRPFLDVTPEQFDRLWQVNLRSPYFLSQQIARDMLKREKGSIVNISSVHGLAGVPEHSAYAATKGAIIAYTRSLAVELAHRGVRVNAIAPGWVAVENYASAMPGYNEAEAAKSAENAVPLGRPGRRLDIAKLAVFLSSEDAEYIVGQTVVADGGTIAMMSLVSDFRTPSTARFGTGYMPGM